MAKSLLVGDDLEGFSDDPEFRMKSFNIDSAVNTDNFAGTIGGASAVDRLRWEISENYLLARRSYQEAPGADNKGLPRQMVDGKLVFPTKPTGTIIAAYKILSHFDVRREFNPSTGEENNVMVEDVISRPWNRRSSMRVDWSKNHAMSTSGDTSWVFGGAGLATALDYAPTDENNDDKPNFRELGAGYFDITNKYVLSLEADSRFGVPECVIVGFYNGGSSFDCTPPEVKMRTSFVRLDEAEDFESFREDFAPRDIIGNWGNAGNSFNREYGAPPITTWDPQYGYTDSKTKTMFAMHNIWEKSHWDKSCSSNEQGDNGTATQCTSYAGPSKGSQCDVNLGKCTIPVRDRAVKTMGWWLNKETPVEYTDTTTADGALVKVGPIEEMTVTWNQLFKVAVAYRREVECRRTGTDDRAKCHALYFEMDGDKSKTQMVAFGGWGTDLPKELAVDKARPAVATCHNPVRSYDPEACGQVGSVGRLGDVRKNYIIYWPFESRAPYGGVASIGADPLTGQMVGATATIMGRSVTRAAAQVRDIIQLNAGETTIDEIITGKRQELFADRVKDGTINAPGSMLVAKTQEEIAAALASIDRESLARAVTPSKTPSPFAQKSDAVAALQARLKLAANGPGVIEANAKLSAALGKLSGSEHFAEYQAGRPALKMVSELERAGVANPDTLKALREFSAMDSNQSNAAYEKYMAYLGQRGVCFHDSQAAAGLGSIYTGSLAKLFQARYASAADAKERGVLIYKELIGEIIKGIGFHEIGHAVGMRHNFSSSWDALNFTPQYWQLRTSEGTKTAECTAGGGACMGPRYVDPMDTDEDGRADESRPGIEYFANTSTMEYQAERFGETVGAGTYDQHFIKTLYGRVLETFDQKIIPIDDQKLFQGKLASQGINDDFVSDRVKTRITSHYTRTARLAKNFDPARDCREATDAEKTAGKWRIVHGKLCASPPKNHIAYEDMKSGGLLVISGQNSFPIGEGQHWHGNDYGSASGDELIRWAYRYGEDYSSGGYMHAKPMDSGADVYEITQTSIRKFDLNYPWAYFRRQNREFAPWAISGGAGGTFARIRGYHWNTAQDVGRASATALLDDNDARPSVLASAEMFNFLQRAALMPEPGTYWTEYETAVKERTPQRAGALLIVDALGARCDQFQAPFKTRCTKDSVPVALIDGRYIQSDFDSNRGGSWDYNQFFNHVGFDEEKVMALRELVDSRPTLSSVSRDNALDDRDVYVSFRSDAPHAVDRLIGGILSEDWETIAPMMLSDKKTVQNFPIYQQDAAQLVRPNGSMALFPNLGYAQQSGMAIYALLYSRSGTDLTLANKLRVRFEGDSGAAPQGAQRVAFSDPISGVRYLAARFGMETIRGRQIDKGIASRMLLRANELASEAYVTTATDPVTGEVTYARSPNGAPQLRVAAAGEAAITEKQLRRYIGMLDVMRQIGNLLGGGPLGNGGGE